MQEYILKTSEGDTSVRAVPDSLITKLSADNIGSLIHLEVKNITHSCIDGSDIAMQIAIVVAIKKDLQDIGGMWHYFLPSLKPSDDKVFLEEFRFYRRKFFYRFILGEIKLAQLVNHKDLWTGSPFHPK